MSMLANGTVKAAGAITTRRSIQVIDLRSRPEHRPLWQSGTAVAVPPTDLPAGGTASPLGYWLAESHDGATAPPGTSRISINSSTAPPTPPATDPAAPRRRPPLTVRVKPIQTGDGDLILVIGADFAHIHASEAAWNSLAEPVLLAICQYFRFGAVDAELDRLTALSHQDLGHATMPGLATLRARRRLEATAREVRALLVDLAQFEAPLTDPLPYCSSERSAQVYTTLAEKLHLEEWCERIDERAEAVEDTYEALTEKLFEYKNFAGEAVLEILIIVILLTELSMTAYEIFSP